MSYEALRISYEAISAVLCIILVRFMIKPYLVTRESRYLGLPLGFGFLGATYALSAFLYSQPNLFGTVTLYLQLIVRAFAFVFLCLTYYFSDRSAENNRSLWNITLVLVVIGLITSILLVSVPDVGLPSYQLTSIFVRVFILICIGYICAHTLRSHIKTPDPETIWTPLGYFFLGISQYSLIIWSIDSSYSAFFGALGLRWVGLAILLLISYRSFYKRRRPNEKNRT